MNHKKVIGIFALQGSFQEHAEIVKKLGYEAKLIRDIEDTKGVEACIIPGGESTSIFMRLERSGLDKWLKESAANGMPIYGTCAGMIILAKLGLIDIKVDRNAYGSQLDSFEKELDVSQFIDNNSFCGIFIRAPKITFYGKKVRVLIHDGDIPLLVQQNNILAGSFHPELTDDMRIHKYFLSSLSSKNSMNLRS
jgi:5'-phosphate synthase pdxT subunit